MFEVLAFKVCPMGQNRTRYMEVFEFVDIQRRNPGIRREDLAL